MVNTIRTIGFIVLIIGIIVFLGIKNSSDDVVVEENLVGDSTESGSIERIIPDITKDKTIDLSGQGLTKVPASIFGRTHIEELNLSQNQLEGSLQAEIRHLQNLRVLNLSHNHFTGVPAEVGQLSNLEVLDLSDNQLTGLPYELGNLSNLKELNLKGNAYAQSDLIIIKEKLPASVMILVD